LVSENEAAIPRFNTRRSLRQPNKWKYDPSNMPPVTIEDYLERKQQAQVSISLFTTFESTVK
jgi:hypothetical protein